MKFLIDNNIEPHAWLCPHKLLNVNTNVEITTQISHFPVRFGKIQGKFICKGLGLVTLDGGPSVVSEKFDCSNNLIQNLVGSPHTINVSEISSEAGIFINGNFIANNNKIKTMLGLSIEQCFDFNISDNLLENLHHGPEVVNGFFYAAKNKLKTLQGCPRYVGRNFSVIDNPYLEVIDCLPEIIGWDLLLYRLNVKSMKNIHRLKCEVHASIQVDYDTEDILGILTFSPYEVNLIESETNTFNLKSEVIINSELSNNRIRHREDHEFSNEQSTKMVNRSMILKIQKNLIEGGFEKIAGY